jgi:hypothetical protein
MARFIPPGKPPSQRRAESGFSEKLHELTRLMVFSLRMVEPDIAPEAIRAKVRDAFRIAMTRDRARLAMISCAEHGAREMIRIEEMLLSLFTNFGFQPDRSNLHKQETWWETVVEAAEEEIANPTEK